MVGPGEQQGDNTWTLTCPAEGGGGDDGPPPPDGGGGGGGGGGTGVVDPAEQARRERCASARRLSDAFVCTSRPTSPPANTSQLEIPSTYQRANV
jgi:hypothetical protein